MKASSTDTQAVRQLYVDFGETLRRARDEKKLTQAALGACVNLSRASIANIERGQHQVALHHLLRLAAALNREPCELLSELPEASHEASTAEARALQGLEGDERQWALRIVRGAAARDAAS